MVCYLAGKGEKWIIRRPFHLSGGCLYLWQGIVIMGFSGQGKEFFYDGWAAGGRAMKYKTVRHGTGIVIWENRIHDYEH